MAFTYSIPPVPGTTDEIRFLIQDTDSSNPIFQDEEIQYYITLTADVSGATFMAAADLCEIAAAKFAREVSISSDQTSIAMEQLQQKYEELAGRLRSLSTRMDSQGMGPIVGGTNWDDAWYGQQWRKEFAMRIHDNNWAGKQTNQNNWWADYEYGGWWNG